MSPNASNSEGVTLLFIHGFLDAGRIWTSVIERLATPGVRAVTLDLSGMGARGQDQGPFSLTRFAAEARKTLSGLDGPIVLVGHSMGAQVAELMAMDQPSRIEGLALFAPVPLQGAHLPPEMLGGFKALGGDVEAQRALRRSLMAEPASRDVLESLTALGASVRPEVVSQLVDAWNRGLDLGLGASPFAGPTLVATGAEDGFINTALAAEKVVTRYASSRAISIPQAGHWPHAEQPKAVAAALDGLLSSLGHSAPSPTPMNPIQGWTEAFADRSPTAFAQALAPEATLEASVLARTVVGREEVKAVLSEASKLYEGLTFTHQAIDGERTYLEWDAVAFGGQHFSGVTILTRDAAGAIVRIAIHHRPLGAAIRFSSALRDRLKGVVGADLFQKGE